MTEVDSLRGRTDAGSLDLGDIQGLILRGYAMAALRLLVLRVDDPAAARSFVAALVDFGPGGALSITTAAPWSTKPPACLNIALSFQGLVALGLPPASLATFPEEFMDGAAARAAVVGDTGRSAPEHWLRGVDDEDAHIFLTVFAADDAALASATVQLEQLVARHAGLGEVFRHQAHALAGHVAHFGYRDGFSQPTIAGAPPSGFADPLPVAPAGEFLLGHPSQHPGLSYPVPEPTVLGRNGSFAAVRILEQDVVGFERFLDESAKQLRIDPELVAAKLCGRWRNGVPLAVSPNTDAPDPPVAEADMNNFDYSAPPDQADLWVGDPKGYRCPIGSHIRRTNPRGSRVAGGGGNLHRLVRRGLPYGPAYDPAHPHDGIPRGLLGLFIGASLADQFEFIMADWVNDGLFAPGLGRSRDPLIGEDGLTNHFDIPSEGGPTRRISGLSTFVTTRGGAYCFLPSLAALRWMARQ